MKNIFKGLSAALVIFLMIGSACGSVVNYNEVNETVEQNTVIDNKPVFNETTQKIVNSENKTYDEVTTTNETVKNVTYEEHTQKQVGEKTVYKHGGKNFKGSQIEKVVLEDGTVIKYADNKNLASCNPKPVSKYVPATLYLKNGTVLDIVIHNEGNRAYQNYGFRENVPVYEDEVTVVNNITNKVTTFINHITEVIYEIINIPQPVPEVNNTTDVPEVNNTTDVNTTDVNTTEEPEVNNTTDVNVTENVTENVTDVPSENVTENVTEDVTENVSENVTENGVDQADSNALAMHSTGYGVTAIVLAIIVIVGLVYVRKD